MLHEGLQELHQKSEWHFEDSLEEARPKYYVLAIIVKAGSSSGQAPTGEHGAEFRP
jgi:hypothetical protein